MLNEFTKLELRKLHNTRDLGGIPTVDGRKIKQGVLFRSGHLHKLPKNTVKSLEQLGIDTVVDLRTDSEKNGKPDSAIGGATYVHCPLVCTATPGITYEGRISKIMRGEGRVLAEKYDDPDDYMVEMYKLMVTDESSVNALKKFFSILLGDSNSVIFHCTSGKDRAGICAMILESILGVDKSMIIKDYAASKAFCHMKFFWNKVGIVIVPESIKFKKFLFVLMRVKELYLEKTMKFLDEKYGGVLEYCKKVLGLTEENFETLKNKYLE